MDIDEDDIDGKRNYNIEEKLLKNNYTGNFVQVLKGEEFNMKYMQENGLVNPIIIYEKTGLGMRVPSENFQVTDVKQCVGSRRMLDVMDVNTQKGMEMSMKEWVRYYQNPERDRLLNVISLEFSHTRLENYVESPTLVRQVDWVDRVWPRHLKECQTEATNIIDRMKYPKVQKYCLMSVAGCYTDFHIDFGGTSVWYHILHGEKVFWLIPPTPDNVERYVHWILSAKQGDYFLADDMDQCQMIRLYAGNTFIIPSGWIHAVYTPVDSLVFGGNFLHSFNISSQLVVAEVEDRTHVPQKFRYPFFNEILWYVLDRYLCCLTGKTYLQKPDIKDEPDDHPDSPMIDEDSRPPSRNPDSRPPSRSLDDAVPFDTRVKVDGEKLSKSITIELTRIDDTMKTSALDEENMKRLSRKCASETSLPESVHQEQGEAGVESEEKENTFKIEEGAGETKVRQAVYLTKFEVEGLKKLIKWVDGLNSWPASKRGVPKDLLDPEALLHDIKLAVEEHENDEPKLACTGEPLLGWPESPLKKIKPRVRVYGSGLKVKVPKGSSGGASSIRRRRTRCKKCEACTRTECGECTFCKDMRKFGGPGRMKQSCKSRQCMAPILPHAAVCMVCGLARRPDYASIHKEEEEEEDDDNPTSSLMECGICWEIVHPQCQRETFENTDVDGVINEDLPSSWECIKCCNAGKQGQLKPRQWKGFGPRPAAFEQRTPVFDQRRLSTNSEDSTSPIPETIQQSGSALIKQEKIETPESPKSPVEGKRVTAKEGLSTKKGPHKVKPQVTKKEKLLRKARKLGVEKNKIVPKMARKLLAATKHKTSTFTSWMSQSSPPSSSASSPSSHQRQGRQSKRASDMEGGSAVDSSGSKRPKREGVDRSQDAGDTTSGRASRDHSPSLKKLRSRQKGNEEWESGSTISPSPGHSRWDEARLTEDSKAGSSRHAGAGTGGAAGGAGSSGGGGSGGMSSQARGSNGSSRAGTPDKMGQFAGSFTGSGSKSRGQDCNTESATGKDLRGVKEIFVVRPAALSSPPEHVLLATGKAHRLERQHWMKVFTHLAPSDLSHCLQVCKAWNRWCIHPTLWRSIDLSRTQIKQQHLCGIVLRQSSKLNLSNASISRKQLAWLVARLPQLKELNLSGQPWAAVSALCSPSTPLLRKLVLSWTTGLLQPCFQELVEPPVGVKPGISPNLSRLHQLRHLDLGGTEISDASLGLISDHLGLLEVLNLTCCMRITDMGLEALACKGRPLVLSLKDVCLCRCLGLTDKCFLSLMALQRLHSLDVSKIPHLSRTACGHFLHQYSYRKLQYSGSGVFMAVE
ncbi:lysine-specific demethylase 2A-like isoform X3 [Pomacea canaliculata]|nr:lysine-specific demethylase 2A-like isoform X3 [Pomacea canaliculata]